jgi:hypothetical protein
MENLFRGVALVKVTARLDQLPKPHHTNYSNEPTARTSGKLPKTPVRSIAVEFLAKLHERFAQRAGHARQPIAEQQ